MADHLYAVKICRADHETVALLEVHSHFAAERKAADWFKRSGWPEQGYWIRSVVHVDLGIMRREGVLEI